MSEPIVYRISGTLPAPWEDFFAPAGSGYPNITIHTADDLKEDLLLPEGSAAPELSSVPSADGWLDVVVDLPNICEDAARLAIAEAIGVADPERIVIDQAGVCQSV